MRGHWYGRHHLPKRQPPWWPPEEPWPPTGPPSWRVWRKMRGRFFWRIGALFALLVLFTVGGITLLLWLAAAALGSTGASHVAMVALRAVGLGTVFLAAAGLFMAGRAMRRLAFPVGDVMEAAGQLAEGNYSVRVMERGPREVRALASVFNQMAARLQAHEEQRRNLLAEIAHELRTPLAVIQGNLEGILDGIYPRDDAHLTPILDETRIAATLIEDLRTLALAETGALKLQREPTDLGALILETVASFRAQADAASVTVTAEVPPNLPILEVDPSRIRQVLANLILNALQHTPTGGSVGVAYQLESGESRGGTVTVSVTDTGSGIAPEDLPRIFERFYKSKESRGSGLGLAIARNLVAAHGGEIEARSEVGKGTTVRFTLPVEQMV